MNQVIQAVADKYGVASCQPPQKFARIGIPALDAVTGGVPKGRIVDIYGGEDTGKTALALALAKGNTLFLDTECKLTSGMVQGRRGFYIMHPETLEDALTVCRTAAAGFDSIVVDSLEALPLKPEQARPLTDFFLEDGDEYAKAREQLLSKALPILSRELLLKGCTLILVNQLRHRPGIMYGDTERDTGGKALPYYSAVRLRVSAAEFIERGRQVAGIAIRIRVVKHKFRIPFGEAELFLDYDTGRLCSRKEAPA